MPLIVRNVEPQELKKTPLLQGVQRRENELERMSVASLTTLIRQLSSLAKHAESIMGDVADALAVYYARSQALEERIRRLKVDVLPSLSDEGMGNETKSMAHCRICLCIVTLYWGVFARPPPPPFPLPLLFLLQYSMSCLPSHALFSMCISVLGAKNPTLGLSFSK